MINGTYLVEMKTLLGNKIGKITVKERDSIISGILDILGHCTELTGKMQENGKWGLVGELITPLHNIAFKAEGYINEKFLDLTLTTEKDTLPLTGEIENTER